MQSYFSRRNIHLRFVYLLGLLLVVYINMSPICEIFIEKLTERNKEHKAGSCWMNYSLLDDLLDTQPT